MLEHLDFANSQRGKPGDEKENKESKLLAKLQLLIIDRNQLDHKLNDPTLLDGDKKNNLIFELEFVRSGIDTLKSQLKELQKDIN